MDAKDRIGFMNKKVITGGNTAQPRVCSKCGAPVKGKFCSKCGTPAGDPVLPPSEPDQQEKLDSAVQGRKKAPEPVVQKPQERASEPVVQERVAVCSERTPGVIRPRTSGGTVRRPMQEPAPRRRNPAAPMSNQRMTESGNTERTLAGQQSGVSVSERRRVKPYVVPARRPAPSRERETGIFRSVQVEEDTEQSVFAQGLPEWNIEPPQFPVKRKSAKTL